ncbi:hypothetical protein ACVI1J_002443 [Bradyrhizobium diazoefficiens]
MLLPKSDPTQEQTNQLTLSDNIARALLQNPRREKKFVQRLMRRTMRRNGNMFYLMLEIRLSGLA